MIADGVDIHGDRPPDNIVMLDTSLGLERPRSPLAEESQPSSKKGRNLGIPMLNEGFANVTDPSGIDGVSMKDALSFKDKHLGSLGLLGNSISIDELDVKDICGIAPTVETEGMRKESGRDPSELFGPWMHVVNRQRRTAFPTRAADHDNSNTSERIGNGSRFAALDSEVLSDILEEVCPPLQLNVQKASGSVDHVLVGGHDLTAADRHECTRTIGDCDVNASGRILSGYGSALGKGNSVTSNAASGSVASVGRVRRQLSDSDRCTICNRGVEDLDHILCFCTRARNLWTRAVKPEILASFLSSPFDSCLRHNLLVETGNVLQGVPWNCRFAIFCWLLWKRRCAVIFYSDFIRHDDILMQGDRLVVEYVISSAHVSRQPSPVNVVPSYWSRPPRG
ncbi:hypothetical protein V6N13_142785 [Hibiscus sabdariffa]